MTTCLGKSCSFGARLWWAFVKFCESSSLPFGIEVGMLDLTVLIPDHCLSIIFDTINRILHSWSLHKARIINFVLNDHSSKILNVCCDFDLRFRKRYFRFCSV